MTDMTQTVPQPPRDDVREAWVAPVIEIMHAGDAEAGLNPVIPEGAFGFGS